MRTSKKNKPEGRKTSDASIIMVEDAKAAKDDMKKKRTWGRTRAGRQLRRELSCGSSFVEGGG